MNHRTSFIRIALLALLGATALLLLCAPAAPAAGSVQKAEARLKAVQARLDSVSTDSEIAVEKYNQASAELAAVQAKIEENQRQLQTAQHNLATANQQLTQRARDMYKSHDIDVADMIFQSSSFDDLVSQMDMLERLGNSDVDTVHAIAAYRRQIKTRRVALKADEDTAAGLVTEREAQKNQLIAFQSHLESLTGKIKAQIKDLKAEAKRRAQLALIGYSGPIPHYDTSGPGHPEVIQLAMHFFGVPYIWGGASPGGFDCSGLTMYVYAEVGVSLYHGATMQQRQSSPIPLSELQPGDLIFFGSQSFSHHVAIFVSGSTCIEAPHSGDVVRYGTWTGRDAWIGGRY